VRTVIATPDGQEEDVESENVGKVESDGNGACSLARRSASVKQVEASAVEVRMTRVEAVERMARTAFARVVGLLAVYVDGSLVGRTVRVVVGVGLDISTYSYSRRGDFQGHKCLLATSCKTSKSTSPHQDVRTERILTIQGSPPCVKTHSHLFLLPSFLNSSFTYLTTRSVTLLMVRLGTRRMENLPLTEQGMTVLLPGAATG
jgi:hypothetical protein